MHPCHRENPITYPTNQTSKYRTANNEDPLLLTLHPFNNLIRALGEAGSGGIRARHAVELKERAGPCERHVVAAHAMDYFEVGVFGVGRGM
jgi:hypothetical protein